MSKDFTLKINRKNFKFGNLGHRFRMQAAEEIRKVRGAAFKDFVGSLPNDPAAMISQTNVALDTYMNGIIISDEDVNRWTSTPEGLYFAFCQSSKKANSDIKQEDIDETFDNLDRDGMRQLRDFWMTALQGSVWTDLMEHALSTITDSLKEDDKDSDESAGSGAGD